MNGEASRMAARNTGKKVNNGLATHGRPANLSATASDEPHHRRPNDDHFLRALGVLDGHRKADRAAHAVAHQWRADDAKLLHELIDQRDEILHQVGVQLFARFAEAPKIQGVGAVVLPQVGHRLLPQSPGAQPSMQKDDRFSPTIRFVMKNSLGGGDG